jgi:hypothetical protein
MDKPSPSDGAKEPVFEVPIQILEEALGRFFLPDHLQHLDLKFADCERLYSALYTYHQNNRIQPVKSPDTVRPNLSFVSLAQGVMVDRSASPYKKGSYLPRNGDLEIPIDEIKRTLLFADAVVVEDPIFAFCRGVMCRTYVEVPPPLLFLEKSLQQLATLRPLLEERLLRLTAFFPAPIENYLTDIPKLAGGAIVGGDVAAATMYRDDRVLRLVAADRQVPNFLGVAFDERRRFIRDLMDEEGSDFEWLYRQAESMVYGGADPDAYCPYLPNDFQYAVFKKLLLRNAKRIENLNVQVVMELNSGCATDPEKIKVAELLDIRRDEQVFSSWRELIRSSVNMAEAQKQDATKLEAFKDEVSNRSRDWKANFQKYNKGRLKDVMTVSKEVSVGGFKAAAGVGAGALFDPTGLTALGSLFYGLYKSARNIETAADRRTAEAAALSFFTSIRDTPAP